MDTVTRIVLGGDLVAVTVIEQDGEVELLPAPGAGGDGEAIVLEPGFAVPIRKIMPTMAARTTIPPMMA